METVELAEGQKFRILCLDGGGIKGVFTAAVLAELEQETGLKTYEHFDLIAGTSTGGILAIGLAMGMPARKILDFYRTYGGEIFPSTGLLARLGWLKQLFKPKHDHEILRGKLKEVLEDRKFGDAKCRLVIPTYNAISGSVWIMKTQHNPRFNRDVGAFAYDVALATSAAPTYYQAATFPHHDGRSYVDGGVWANCPAMVATTEAIAFLGQKPGNIDILNVGTTFSPFNIAKRRKSGAAQWNMGIIDLMFESQVEAARAQAGLIAGDLLRIDANCPEGEYSLDKADPQTIINLAALGSEYGAKLQIQTEVKKRFFNGVKVQPFSPVLQSGSQAGGPP